jgi:hypothetical protein
LKRGRKQRAEEKGGVDAKEERPGLKAPCLELTVYAFHKALIP